MKYGIYFVVIVVLLGAGCFLAPPITCAQEPVESYTSVAPLVVPDDWSVYQDVSGQWWLKHPSNWTVVGSSPGQVDFRFDTLKAAQVSVIEEPSPIHCDNWVYLDLFVQGVAPMFQSDPNMKITEMGRWLRGVFGLFLAAEVSDPQTGLPAPMILVMLPFGDNRSLRASITAFDDDDRNTVGAVLSSVTPGSAPTAAGGASGQPGPVSIPTIVPLLQPAPPQAPAGSGRIAFASIFQGNYEIYTINPDGSNLTQWTNTLGDDWHPAWSPDGSKIAYQCKQDGRFALCMMDADGRGSYGLLDINGDPGNVQRPTWSPDGRYIACSVESTASPAVTGIEIVPVDGSNIIFLTNGRDPSWSPDGARITFMDMESRQVMVINTDGSGKRQLTNNPGICNYPTWSPNGAQIAYSLGYSVEGEGIHVMNADGSNDRLVLPETSWGLAWSPDGTELAISSNESLMIVNATSGGVVRTLTQGIQPSWSPWGGGTVASAQIEPYNP